MILQVFEYQTLHIGRSINGIVFTEDHYQALARFAEQQPNKYFHLLYKGVRFSHYVGALQVGNLTIEILPKADKHRKPNTKKWQEVLLEMLHVCKLLQIETLNSARLRLRSNSILDLYFELFLEEVDTLMRRGLQKSYRLENEQLSVLKGRIDFPKQLTKGHLKDTHFYTRYQRYEHDHLLNQILYKALSILDRLLYQPSLKQKVRALLRRFPKVTDLKITERHFDQITDQRKAKPYKKALNIARLIILNYSPDIRGGQHDLIAILFDMNLLFEEYVFRLLQKVEGANWTITRQARRPFWKRRNIRPDILMEFKNGADNQPLRRIVLDTKWKHLAKAQPSIEELKQMYVYCQYFNAKKAVLLYPYIEEIKDLPATAYQPTEGQGEKYSCQVLFLEILKDGKLNKELGADIMKKLNHKAL